jgi:hypothetical protein
MIEFVPFPKIPRLHRDIIITEKLDGTNASVHIGEDHFLVGSRNRFITPGDDNFGFAAWAYANAKALRDVLGHGSHFGEWVGRGIQRGYGMQDRMFALFNTSRWSPDVVSAVPGLTIVPQLYSGPFSEEAIQNTLRMLRTFGSAFIPFMHPEGIIVYHTAAAHGFKVTLMGDDAPKSKAA